MEGISPKCLPHQWASVAFFQPQRNRKTKHCQRHLCVQPPRTQKRIENSQPALQYIVYCLETDDGLSIICDSTPVTGTGKCCVGALRRMKYRWEVSLLQADLVHTQAPGSYFVSEVPHTWVSKLSLLCGYVKSRGKGCCVLTVLLQFSGWTKPLSISPDQTTFGWSVRHSGPWLPATPRLPGTNFTPI